MDYKYIKTEYLDSIAGDDQDIIIELVKMFSDQAVEMHKEMTDLNSKKDYLSLGLLAHKAKSSVAIMGMNDLAVMLKNFELLAKEGKDPGLYDAFITRFGDETRSAINELNDLANNRIKKS